MDGLGGRVLIGAVVVEGLAVKTSFKGFDDVAETGVDTGAEGRGCRAALLAGFGVLKDRDIVGEGRTAVIVEGGLTGIVLGGMEAVVILNTCFRGRRGRGRTDPVCVKINLL